MKRLGSSIVWSIIDQGFNMGLVFLGNMVLARLLLPEDFGLFGLLLVVIAISDNLVNSGLSQALIIRKNCSAQEYSTVNTYNMVVSVIMYLSIYFTSAQFASFFKEDILEDLLKVLGIVIIIDSAAIVHRTKLIKSLAFRNLAVISLKSNIVSILIALGCAFMEYGVWSLVILKLSRHVFTTIQLIGASKLNNSFFFDFKIFRSMFSYGIKLTLSGLIDVVFRNAQNVIIGRYFSIVDLGFYSKADEIKALPTTNFSNAVERAFFPVIADEKNKGIHGLSKIYSKFTKAVTFTVLFLLSYFIAVPDNIVAIILGQNWANTQTATYLRLLSISAIFLPSAIIYGNIMKTMGKSGLFLKLELFKKALFIPVLLIGIKFGIIVMLYAGIIRSIIALIFNSYIGGKSIDYGLKFHLTDLAPSICVLIINSLFLSVSASYFQLGNVGFILLTIIDFLILIGVCEALRFPPYLQIKGLRFALTKKLAF